MWKIHLKDGRIIVEGQMKWADVPKDEVVKLEANFAGQTASVVIPPNTTPIVFNTGEVDLGNGIMRQISISIGYCMPNFVPTLGTNIFVPTLGTNIGEEEIMRIAFDGIIHHGRE